MKNNIEKYLCFVFQDQPEGLFGCRKTQYSAETGRLIPPSSKSSQRVSRSQQHIYPQPFHDQELMVRLELFLHQPSNIQFCPRRFRSRSNRASQERFGKFEPLLPKVASVQKIASRNACYLAPNLTDGPNMNQHSFFFRFWSCCVRSCKPIP